MIRVPFSLPDPPEPRIDPPFELYPGIMGRKRRAKVMEIVENALIDHHVIVIGPWVYCQCGRYRVPLENADVVEGQIPPRYLQHVASSITVDLLRKKAIR